MRMASSKGYLDYILEQLSELNDVAYRAMMGEYIIYYRKDAYGTSNKGVRRTCTLTFLMKSISMNW